MEIDAPVSRIIDGFSTPQSELLSADEQMSKNPVARVRSEIQDVATVLDHPAPPEAASEPLIIGDTDDVIALETGDIHVVGLGLNPSQQSLVLKDTVGGVVERVDITGLAGVVFDAESANGQTIVRVAPTGAVLMSPSDDRFITTTTEDLRVAGDKGDDAIFTGAGNDIVSGGDGADLIKTGDGDDTIIGGTGSDIMTGGAGADVFAFHADDFAEGRFTAKYITDFTAGVDKIELSGLGVESLADLQFKSIGRGDIIDLGAARFIVLKGMDIADIGDFDIIGASPRSFDLVVDPLIHHLTDAADQFISTDDQDSAFYGFGGADAMVAGSGSDTIHGGDGNDEIIAGAGDDRIIGGEGLDILTGRAGADTFVFFADEDTSGADHVTDFEVGIDVIELSGFGLDSTDDLLWQTTGSGIALRVAPDRQIVFDGFADQSQLIELKSHWIFGTA